MKRRVQGFVCIVLAFLLLPAIGVYGAEQDVSKSVVTGSQVVSVAGGKRTVQYVKVNLNDTRLEVRPVLAHGEIGKTQSLEGMASQHGALAAINGSFFMAYNEGEHKPPWGLIVIDYQKKHDGTSGASIGFNQNSLPVISTTSLIRADHYEHITSAGPTLLQNGQIVLNPQAEGMNDPKLTTLGGQRSFIGYTADNYLVFGTVSNVTLPQLAQICQSMGLTAAMNLDGGASSGLYAHGKLLTRPGRELSNALVVTTRKSAPVQVVQGGQQLVFSKGPLLIQGSLYVPAEEIVEKLGVQPAGKPQYFTRIIADTPMVPLRAVAESLGMRVEWDAAARIATIVDGKLEQE